jgi:nucleoporin GLE1
VYTPLRANPAHQKDFKTYERQIVKLLQQIAATQEQVNIKSRDLLQLLNDTRIPTQFLLVTLGSKLLSQIEIQVLKLPSYAFALAQVIVNVASQVPALMDVVLGKLHEVCIFTVPKYYVFTKDQFESDAAYYKALGYREDDGKLETTDEYVARMAAHMTFYGALVQTDVAGGQNPHGLAAGWAWIARLLNHIVADRNTASVLEAFLKMAGYRLYQVYPKPFMRVMQAIVTEFIEKLKTNGDADARAVVSRLETYLHLQKYLQEPEGRKMPASDISSSLRA